MIESAAPLLRFPSAEPPAGIAPSFRGQFDGVPQVPTTALWELEPADSRCAPTSMVALTAGQFIPAPAVGPTSLDADGTLLSNGTLAAWQVPSPLIGSSLETPAPRIPVEPWSGRIATLLSRRMGCDLGIGHERVMFAPHVVETAVGTANTSVLIRADRGLATPDRLETIWAAPSRGPGPESRVDILDTVFRMDLGNEKAMVMTEYTMRSLNPERNDNTTGFGDMVVGAKGTLFDGQNTKIASVFRTYLKTGPSDRGLGTGHVSLEPGFLLRHQLTQHTYFHGEAKYWLPIAGTPAVAGDVLKLGAALSTVWKETDSWAILPTLEFSSYTFLAGSTTQSNGIRRRVNGEFAGELYPGLRWVRAPGYELGLLEYGLASGFIFADDGWFDSRLVFDIRFAR